MITLPGTTRQQLSACLPRSARRTKKKRETTRSLIKKNTNFKSFEWGWDLEVKKGGLGGSWTQFQFEFANFSLFLTHLELTRSYTPVVPSKPYPITDQNGESVYLFADQNREKTLPDEAEHTYIIYISEFPPGIPLNRGFFTRAIDRNVLFRNWKQSYCPWSSPHGTRSFFFTLRFSRIFPDNWTWQSSTVGLAIP